MSDFGIMHSPYRGRRLVNPFLDLQRVKFEFPNYQEIYDALDGGKEERVAALFYEIHGHTITFTKILPLHNRHKDPKHHFSVYRSETRIFPRYSFILAHSHPSKKQKAGPSQEDLANLSDFCGAVFHVFSKTLTFFRRNGDTREISLITTE